MRNTYYKSLELCAEAIFLRTPANDYQFNMNYPFKIYRGYRGSMNFDDFVQIDQREFNYIDHIRLELIGNLEEERKAEKLKFTPKMRYQLYNEDNSIAIYGFTDKSRSELVDFIEIYGREQGFRIRDKKGQTTGFIHSSLLNKLSYHITSI